MIEGRLPPQSLDAERAVLGAALIDPDVLGVVSLDPADFYRESHRLIWRAIIEVTRRREPPDIVTVAAELERRGEIEEVGGRAALADLSNSTPTSVHAESYAAIVKQKAVSRQLINAAAQVAQVGYDDLADPDEARDRAEAALFAASRGPSDRKARPIGSVLSETITELLDLRLTRRVPGVDTGLRSVNDLTGGLQRSDLIILAARPSVGKTSLALNIAEFVTIQHAKSVGFFSLEMSQQQLIMRILSSMTGIDGYQLRQTGLSESDLEHYGDELDAIGHAPLFIDDAPNASIVEIRTKARRLQTETNLALVVVDYLQLMRSMSKEGNRVQEVSDISRGLKALARELNIPVLALSQLNRSVEGRGESMEPRLSDLRESGSIEQDADVVMFLWRERQADAVTRDLVRFKIAKHRNGPIGETELRFDRHHTRFLDL